MAKPTFLIMGAQKAGTTSLYDALVRHPMVGRAAKKELHFFDRHFNRGWQWYEEQLPLRPGQSHIGEASPAYMYDPKVRDRIADNLPDIKIIISLRDPVARAYSHYWHSRRYGREELDTFEEALAAEPERLATAPRRKRMWWSYQDRGHYIDQLEAIEKRYGRDAMCVVSLEEMKRDAEAELSRVLHHLRLDPELMPALQLRELNSYHQLHPKQMRQLRAEGQQVGAASPSSYPPLAEETRKELQALFADSDSRLRSWLGRPLPWSGAAG